MKNKKLWLLLILCSQSCQLIASTDYSWTGAGGPTSPTDPKWDWDNQANWDPDPQPDPNPPTPPPPINPFPNSAEDTASFVGLFINVTALNVTLPPDPIQLQELIITPSIEPGALLEVINFQTSDANPFQFNQDVQQNQSSLIVAKSVPETPESPIYPFILNFELPISLGTAGTGLLNIECYQPAAIEFNGVISGGGGILITPTSTGNITLYSNCTYQGDTVIGGGNLIISSTGLLPSSQDVTINGGTLTINSQPQTVIGNLTGLDGSLIITPDVGAQLITLKPSTIANYQGSISGNPSATLEILGTGTQIFSGANTFAGTTRLTDGTLQINSQNNLGTGPLEFYGGKLSVMQTTDLTNSINAVLDGSLSAAANAIVTYSGLINGNAGTTLLTDGPGAICFSGINSFEGTTDIRSGRLQINTQSNLGTGPISLSGGMLNVLQTTSLSNDITLEDNTASTISTAVGTTTTLLNPFTGSGNLTIGTGASSGTVSVSGTNTANHVLVSAGATLKGTGTLTATTIIQGTASPGNSPGTLINVGNWTQDSGSTYIATPLSASLSTEVYTAPYTNLLSITGDLTINPGAKFKIDLHGFCNPNSYEVIDFTASRTGTFETIIQGSPFVLGTLSYEANAICLQLNHTELLGPSISWNAQQVANSFKTVFLSGSSALDEIFDQLLPLSPDQRDNALDQMHPATFKALTLTQENNSFSVNSALTQRFEPLLTGKYHARQNKSKLAVQPSLPTIRAVKIEELQTNQPTELIPSEQDLQAATETQIIFEVVLTQVAAFKDTDLALNEELNQTLVDHQSQGTSSTLQVEHNESKPIEHQDTNCEQVAPSSLMAVEQGSEVDTKSSDRVNKKPFHLWINPLGDFLHQSKLNFAGSPQVGYGAKTSGLVGGIDYHFYDHYYLGAVGAYTHSTLQWSSNHGHGDIDSGYAGVYLSAIGQIFYGNLSVIGAWTEFDVQRNVIFPGVNVSAVNQHRGTQIISHLDAGLNVGFKSLTIRPFDSFDFIAQQENPFQENGANIYNLSVGESHANMLRNELGAHMSYSYFFSELNVSLDTKWSWVREIRTAGKQFSSTFAAVDLPFASIGYFPNRNLFSCGATVTVTALQDRLTYSIYYNGVFGSKYSDNGLGGRCSFSF